MNLRYLFLLITLKNINCYNSKQRTQTSSSSNFKKLKSKSDPVIPARYKITSKTNYEDPTIIQSFPAEYFPEVEYPESVVDSSKPFYLSASPFPNDVKSSFNTLIAQSNSKAKTTTDYSWIHNENNKEKDSTTSQEIDMNDIIVTKENDTNFDEKNLSETFTDITTLGVEDKTVNDEIMYSDNDKDRLLTNWSSTEQSAKCQDEDYFVGFIHDLDEVMKNLTNAEITGPDESNISAVHTFESECPDEFKLVNSDTEPNNNDSIIKFNGNSFDTEEHPERIWSLLFDDSDTNDALTSLTSVLNAYLTNTSSVEDMQSDFCSIGTIANETNTSCADS